MPWCNLISFEEVRGGVVGWMDEKCKGERGGVAMGPWLELSKKDQVGARTSWYNAIRCE